MKLALTIQHQVSGNLSIKKVHISMSKRSTAQYTLLIHEADHSYGSDHYFQICHLSTLHNI